MLEAKIGPKRAGKHTFIIGRFGSKPEGDHGVSMINMDDQNWCILAIRNDMLLPVTDPSKGASFGRMHINSEVYLIIEEQPIENPGKAQQGLHTGYWFFLD